MYENPCASQHESKKPFSVYIVHRYNLKNIYINIYYKVVVFYKLQSWVRIGVALIP